MRFKDIKQHNRKIHAGIEAYSLEDQFGNYSVMVRMENRILTADHVDKDAIEKTKKKLSQRLFKQCTYNGTLED